MMMKHTFLSLAIATLTHALNPIEVQRQDFVDSATGDRFEIIGVGYQPGGEAGFDPESGEDPLSNGQICLRDAALMQRMGLNTIRTYNVDPAINHDECASIFNAVGIYMMIDVNSPLPGDSINRADPESTYNADYLERAFSVIEAFKDYPNVIGFFSGNEIINDQPTALVNPQYIRAVTRDLKAYVASRANRDIPIGYSAADVRDLLTDTSNYLQCTIEGEGEGSANSRSDFFGLNSYSWCGADATFETSNYDELAADFAATTIPVFFSEFGCIVPSPRQFDEIPVLYGPLMTTWSGGLVYQWTEEDSPEGEGYGLIQVADDGSVQLTRDFNTLQTRYSELDFDQIESRNATARNLTPPECDSDLIESPGFEDDFDLPNMPSGVQSLINNGVDGITAGSIVSLTRTAVDDVVTQVGGSTSSGLTIARVSSAARPTAAPTGANGGSKGDDDSDGNSASPTSNAAPGASAYAGSHGRPVLGFSFASVLLWYLG